MISKITIKVSGMSCAACSSRIEKELSKLNGIINVNAVFSNNIVSVEYDDEKITQEKIKQTLEKIGYSPIEKQKNESEWKLNNILISAILTIILSIYAMGPMFGLNVPFENDHLIYSLIQLILTIPVLWLCRKFFIKGIPALISRSPTMDSLVALGSGTAFVYSLYLTMSIATNSTLSHSLCYDSVAMILTLISVGKFLEFRSREKADDAVKKLLSLVPETAHVKRNNKEIEVKIEDVENEEILIVRPGERIPADGTIIEGNTSINESMLTGESLPVMKNIGNFVYAGTLNIDGYFEMKISTVGEGTVLSDIINLMEEAKATKAPVARTADKIASVFVPVVIFIALVSGILWYISGKTVGFSLNIVISVLVISCPCALGLATPLAITVGAGKATEFGILYRDATSLEKSGKINSIIFDKTGTLTKGELKVEQYVGDNDCLPYVLSGEMKSEHPIGNAIVKYCQDNNISEKPISNFEYNVGKGISFVVDDDNYIIGSPNLFDEDIENDGNTHILVYKNNKKIGKFLISDSIRDEAKNVVKILNEKEIEMMIVTGDNAPVAENIGKKIGIENIYANALPTDKVEAVKSKQIKEKDVMMVGDGINDSPALAQSNLGVALSSGSNIALSSSDVVLLNDDLYNIPRIIDFGKQVLKNIKENLFLAFCYNVVCIPIAAGLPYLFGMEEFTHMPMIAALAMSLSSLSVVTNALRLRFFNPKY